MREGRGAMVRAWRFTIVAISAIQVQILLGADFSEK